MKICNLLVVLSVLSLACSVSTSVVGSKYVENSPKTTVLSDVQPSVISTNGLRLRSLPDTLGSEELTIIPFGKEFHPYYCIDVQGTTWAFGAYTDEKGVNWLGYVAARYLSGGCR